MSDASLDQRVAALADAVDSLSRRVEAQQEVIAAQEAELAQLRAAPPTTTGGARVGRRTLLGLGGAGVVGSILATSAAPAAAADGDPITAGVANTASSLTTLTSDAGGLDIDASGVGLHATSSGGVGVRGSADAAAGVAGDSSSGPGVTGTSTSGTGVTGDSDTGAGVVGNAGSSGDGVRGNSGSGFGVRGVSTSGDGVNGTSGSADGVSGTSTSGPGVRAFSSSGVGLHATGGRAPILLAPAATGVPSPTGHAAGELFVTSSNDLYYFDGSDFTKLNDQSTGVAGDPLLLEDVNSAGSSTQLNTNETSLGGPSFGVTQTGGAPAVPAIAGTSNASGAGVAGTANGSGEGVLGTAGSGDGVRGVSTSGDGVSGSSTSGPGVRAFSNTGVGLTASGGRAAIRLEPDADATPTGAHQAGDLFMGADGDLYLYTSATEFTKLNDQGVVGGDPLLLEDVNTTNTTTQLNTTGGTLGGPSFGVTQTTGTPTSPAIAGTSNGSGAGVAGVADGTGDGVTGTATGGGDGVVGTASGAGAGVRAVSTGSGPGVLAIGDVPLRLQAGTTPGPPTTGSGTRGDLYLDSAGRLYLCRVPGSPGTWSQLLALSSPGNNTSASTQVFSTSAFNGPTFAVVQNVPSPDNGAAIYAQTNGNGAGVYGVGGQGSNTGPGVFGISGNGYGAELSGGKAPLRLTPKATAGPPSTGPHSRGELVVDNAGHIFLCTTHGTPGSWAQLDRAAGAGGPLLLPAPQRAYDSRPGQAPTTTEPGGKGTFVAGTVRTIDLNAATSVAPDATSVLLNVTITQTVGHGYLTVWRNGVAQPPTSTINWFQSGMTVANGTTVACDAQQRIRVYASSPTHVVIDVIGYYT